MAEKTAFELVSPERLLASLDAEMVVVPGADGNFGALKGHAPLISTLRPGVIDVYETRPTVSRRIFVGGGFVEVTPDRCTVLAKEAIPVEELDRAAVEQEVKDCSEDLADAKTDHERAAAAQALAVARAKLEALRG
jgi:F-type H+-transporting ATPase subunit epsilon